MKTGDPAVHKLTTVLKKKLIKYKTSIVGKMERADSHGAEEHHRANICRESAQDVPASVAGRKHRKTCCASRHGAAFHQKAAASGEMGCV